MPSEYIKKIRTTDGDKQIDYESLANLPKINNTELKGNVNVVEINQGSSNSGKFLGIGADGNVSPMDPPKGATVEQVTQIEKNKTDISSVKEDVSSLSEEKVGYRGILNTSNYPHTELKYLLKPGDYCIDEPLTATLTDLPENFIGLNKMLNCEVRRAFSGRHYIQKIYSTSSYADPLIRIV